MIRQLAVLAGAGTGLGLTLVVDGSLPRQPDMASVPPRPPQPSAASGRQSTLTRIGTLASTHLPPGLIRTSLRGTSSRDLDLIGSTREHLLASKLGMAVLGLLAAPMVTLVLHTGGVHLPAVLAAAATLALVAGCFRLPDLDVRQRAERARLEVTRTVALYLVLVALERRASAGATQALLRAAQAGRSWPWVRIRDALDRANLDRRPAWDGLVELGTQIGVPELGDVADIMRGSGEHGTAVHQVLLAKARSLRAELAARHQSRANADSERMVVPVALLGLAYIALLAYPVVSRIASG